MSQFVIFCRDRERKQRAGADAGGDGTGAMDLVSFVELQANMKAILASHLSALKAIRGFWRELLKKVRYAIDQYEHGLLCTVLRSRLAT